MTGFRMFVLALVVTALTASLALAHGGGGGGGGRGRWWWWRRSRGKLLRGTAMGLRSATVVGQRSLRLVANIGPAPQPGASPPRGQEAVIRAVE